MKDNELIIYDLISPLKSLIKEIEQKATFDKENPKWAEYFSDRK